MERRLFITISKKRKSIALTKNYRGITLTSIASKIYNLMLLNIIRPKIEDILNKTKTDLEQIDQQLGKY